MNPALLQKGSNSFRTDSEIKDHEGMFCSVFYPILENSLVTYEMVHFKILCYFTFTV